MPEIHTHWMEDFFLAASAGTLPAPPSAWWVTTRACNLACKYCFSNGGTCSPDELTTEEAITVLNDFAESGVVFVTFLGGEPLCRRDIFDLINYATDLGIYAAILTNGLLVTEKTITRLQEVGCEMVGVSIDHDDPAIHDTIRGRDGSLEAARRTVRMAIEAGIRTSVRIVVTPDNYQVIPRLFRWALDQGVDELILLPLFVVGRAQGNDDRKRDLFYRKLFIHTLDELREMATAMGIHIPENRHACSQTIELNQVGTERHHAAHALGIVWSSGCKVGKYSVSVQPNGDIHPCPFVPVSIGNLRQQCIREIWQTPLLKQARINRVGCMARALIHRGVPEQPDPTYT